MVINKPFSLIFLMLCLGLIFSCKSSHEEVPVSSVSVSVDPSSGAISSTGSTAVIELGKTLQLNVVISPSNASGYTIVWTSSDTKIATVSQTGLVTPVSTGTVTITVTVNGKSQNFTITVQSPVVDVISVSLDKTSLTLEEGSSQTLSAKVSPENATDKTVVWSSSNTAVATVASGTVTAVSVGTAVITAKSGNKSATCNVTVNKKVIPVTSVTLDITEIDIWTGKSITLTATVYPAEATDKTIVWTSSNSGVATVENGIVTAISAGTATITAKCGEQTATCQIKVKSNTGSIGNRDEEDL